MRNLALVVLVVGLSACIPSESEDAVRAASRAAPAAATGNHVAPTASLTEEGRRNLVSDLCRNGPPRKAQHGVRAARVLIDEGWKSFEMRQAASALDHFAASVAVGKDFPDAYWGLALAGYASGYPDVLINGCFARAEGMFDAAPAGFYSDWGRVLEDRKQPRKAIAKFERSLAIDPNHLQAHVGLARAHLALGDEAAAGPHIDAVKRLQSLK